MVPILTKSQDLKTMNVTRADVRSCDIHSFFKADFRSFIFLSILIWESRHSVQSCFIAQLRHVYDSVFGWITIRSKSVSICTHYKYPSIVIDSKGGRVSGPRKPLDLALPVISSIASRWNIITPRFKPLKIQYEAQNLKDQVERLLAMGQIAYSGPKTMNVTRADARSLDLKMGRTFVRSYGYSISFSLASSFQMLLIRPLGFRSMLNPNLLACLHRDGSKYEIPCPQRGQQYESFTLE